jgi:hypothetical protein
MLAMANIDVTLGITISHGHDITIHISIAAIIIANVDIVTTLGMTIELTFGLIFAINTPTVQSAPSSILKALAIFLDTKRFTTFAS